MWKISNFGLSSYIKMKFWLCHYKYTMFIPKTKHRVYLVFVLCDYIHTAVGQLEV